MDFSNQVTLLISRIKQIKSNNQTTRHDKYLQVNTYYASIVSAIATTFPDVMMKDIQPLTEALEGFNEEYFKRLL